jgi:hypothetical protein
MKILLIALLFSFLSIGCNKEDNKNSCYDSSLVHNGFCTTDCPGVEGCDGKTYCNECEAARHGIRVK